jgi:hypothetical protein
MSQNRTKTDDCLICLKGGADKTNSHLIPASLIKHSVGKRDHEQSYLISATNSKIDEFFGRANTKNTSTIIKQNHFARDFYFCSECEKRLGVLEGEIIPYLSDKIKDEKFSNNFSRKTSFAGLPYVELQKVDSIKFQVCIYSIVYRIHLLYSIDYNQEILTKGEVEDLRKILYHFLYGEEEAGQLEYWLDYYTFVILTVDKFTNSTKNLVLTGNFWNKPNIFIIFEYSILFYSAYDDRDEIKSPLTDLYSLYGDQPKIGILTEELWDRILYNLMKLAASDFLNSLGKKLSKVSGFSIEICRVLIYQEAKKIEREENKFGYYCIKATNLLIKSYRKTKK